MSPAKKAYDFQKSTLKARKESAVAASLCEAAGILRTTI